MRFLGLILLILPLGLSAQMWFKNDSALVENPYNERYSRGKNIFTRPLYSYKKEGEKQYLVVNPWFSGKLSRSDNKNLLKNGRGVLVEGQHGRFRYFSGIQEVQEDAYTYQKNVSASSAALRGHNRTKINNEGIYDYADFLAGLEYQGKQMRYSIGWHPVKIGSGIRPMFVSHLNTGFFNYQIAFRSKSKKLNIAHGNGTLFGSERLQSNSNSEAGILRSRINWINFEYRLTEKLSIAIHTDATSKLYNDSSEQIRPTIIHYFPIPLGFDSRTKNRIGSEIKYHTPVGKLYAGVLNTSVVYGGFSGKKQFSNELEILLSGQLTKHSNDTTPNIAQFGNDYSTAYPSIQYDALTQLLVNYQNIRFESSLNYFDAESSKGMNIFASLGYCIHPPSEMIFYAFVEKRQFPASENYIGIGIRNNLGLSRKTY